ncbi:hypothetical protein N7533_011632 [Penicillium manginii]|uniref:uncharacterized protein n=1 Tax=Penicillium manginii TaxID=203109 RepID=UPI0025478BC2|nr:uncharacterized protein N7533_011632 [Penicillium manginii]KAJ5742223.1 hypothetical protein N7533_011632 [Penicillium manginii]
MVPVCFEKSRWTIVAMLAVLKTGATCVPMDPSHPDHRLQSIATRVRAATILTSPANQRRFTQSARKTIAVDQQLMDGIPGNVTLTRLPTISPSALAFVMFTSGSTGEPKGIRLPHTTLGTSMRAHGAALLLGPGKRVFQFSGYGFDLSLQEMFTSLLFGACVCVPSEEQRINDLPATMERLRVNCATLTPTVVSLFRPADVPSLRHLVLAGEALRQETVDVWRPKSSGLASLNNCYGPAECTIYCSWNGNVGREPTQRPANVGIPWACHHWVIDPSNHDVLAPVGCIGELLVEGPIVSEGYLDVTQNNPFIQDPEWSRAQDGGLGRRMYKTGDLVRWHEDGTLDYLGRKDTQVKVHGQRIELAEVEQAITASTPELRSATVDLVSGRLAAFFCYEEGEQHANGTSATAQGPLLPVTSSLRAVLSRMEMTLSTLLPIYMVPALYIPIQTLPVNTSGKTDRRRLKEWTTQLSEEELQHYALAQVTDKVPPTTVMERKIQLLWSILLKMPIESIGKLDNFLRVGGDSVNAMQLVAEARNARISLTVADIFKSPILQDMALAAKLHDPDTEEGEPVEPFALIPSTESDSLIRQVGAQLTLPLDAIADIYPCAPMQEGLIALSAKQTDAYLNQTVFQLPSTIDIAAFKAAWELVYQQAEILRSRIVYIEGQGNLQVVCKGEIEWETTSSLARYSTGPCDYGTTLTRYAIIQEAGKDYFVWTAHHAVYDGWTTALVFNMLQQALSDATVTPVRPYREFISYISRVPVVEQAAYWATLLEGSTPSSFPPPSAERPGNAVGDRYHTRWTFLSPTTMGLLAPTPSAPPGDLSSPSTPVHERQSLESL